MSSEVAIRLESVGKKYEIYNRPADRLKQFFAGHRHQYFKEFWALRGVNLEVARGEAVGVLGRNGSGKSTLLQLIAGTLTPTEGSIATSGRIAALLELGSGFSHEFTGRENIFLNGALLGLSRQAIEDRFDDIAAFADIGEYIDQPVKTYSSGMVVRLAFAVQVQLEPDILIVDEALAVGDSLFQKRCFQKMEQLLSEGTTLFFVSHDVESVRTLTTRAILLDHGHITATGNSAEVVLQYRKLLHEQEKAYFEDVSKSLLQRSRRPAAAKRTGVESDVRSERSDLIEFGDLDAEIIRVRIFDAHGSESGYFEPGQKISFVVSCKVHHDISRLNVGIRIRNKEGVKIYSWGTLNQDISIWSGKISGETFWDRSFQAGEEFDVTLSASCSLGSNVYEVQAYVTQEEDQYFGNQRMLHWMDEAAFFHSQVRLRDYFFGGCVDLKMAASW